MAAPTDETGNILISLAQRAPAGPIPTRTWHIYLRPGFASLEYKNLLEQKNPCIRSQLAHLSLVLTAKVGSPAQTGFNVEVASGHETTRFPYPTAFRKWLRTQPQTRILQTLNIGGVNDISFGFSHENHSISGGDNRSGDVANNTLPRQDPPADEQGGFRRVIQAERVEWQWGFSSPWLGVTRTSVIEHETQIQPVYIVLGIFPRGYHNPQERVVFVEKPERLFRELRWAAFRLRGLSSTLLSLRQVKSFRLYRCNAEEGTHEHIHLDSNGVADLQLLLHTYKSWYVPRYIALAWANWIHQTLNNSSHDVLDGTFAIELVLDWSVTRISIVVLFPVLLSLAISVWLKSSAWTDLATIQTAWGTASYVVTAGGLLAALLAITSGIADK